MDAIRLFLYQSPDAAVRFLVQWNHPLSGADGWPIEPGRELEGDRRLTFIRERLDSEHYMTRLESIDCMVLPYRKSAYGGRISGIAVEAATAGQCLIELQDMWLSDLMEDHRHGLAIPDGDAGTLAAAMVATFDDRQAMAAAARDGAVLARAFHSNDRFVDLLWSNG